MMTAIIYLESIYHPNHFCHHNNECRYPHEYIMLFAVKIDNIKAVKFRLSWYGIVSGTEKVKEKVKEK